MNFNSDSSAKLSQDDLSDNRYIESLEKLAVNRLRICLAIFIVLFPLFYLLDFLGTDPISFAKTIPTRVVMEVVFFVLLGLTTVPEFKKNVYVFTFLLSILMGLHNLFLLMQAGDEVKDYYIVFALTFSIMGVFLPWGARAMAGLCIPSYLFYPLGIWAANIASCESSFFLKSNVYLIFFIAIVIVAAYMNELLRIQDFGLQKKLESENVLLQGYQMRLKRAYERMENLATVDPLTHVYNRTHLTQWLQVEIFKNKEAADFFSMIMYDLDHFKEVNDFAGHQTGDLLLKRQAEIVQEKLPSNTPMFRYGGDEFCIILPGVDLKEAVKISEDIRKHVANHPDLRFDHKGEVIQVTLSMGVTTQYVGDSTIDTNFLIRWIDAALFESKRKGRNLLHVFDPLERKIYSHLEWQARQASSS